MTTKHGGNSPLVIDLVSPASSPRSKNEKSNDVIDLLHDDDDVKDPPPSSTLATAMTEAAIATTETATASLKRARDSGLEPTVIRNPYLPVKRRSFEEPTPIHETNTTSTGKPLPAPPLVVIRDDVEVTTDLLSLLDNLNVPNAVNCISRSNFQKHHCAPHLFKLEDKTIDSTLHSYSSLPLHHIQQRDKWSCGFRNLQMLLTALLPHYPQVPEQEHTQVTDNNTDTARVIDIPTVSELQAYLEECWAAGYDPRGAQHYQYRIVGKCSKIGAVEVSSVLTFQWGVDSTVVQFIKCSESRRLLPHFVWNYFTSTMASTTNECQSCKHVTSKTTSERAQILLDLIATDQDNCSLVNGSSMSEMDKASACSCPLLPLYLQWEGHSVTIVGIERKAATGSSSVTTAAASGTSGFYLLVFDPGHSGQARKRELVKGNASRMRLDCQKLSQKDCQIVMCSLRSLTLQEKLERKQRIEAVTGGKQAVMQHE